MLGFSTFAETTFGESTTSAAANAFLTGAIGTSAAGTFTFDCEASVTPPAVTATGGVGIVTEDGNAILNIGSVAGTLASGAAAGSGAADKPITGVTTGATAVGSFVAGTTVTGKANPIIPNAVGTGAANSPSGKGKASLTLASATATATFGDFADEDAQGSKTITGVSSTGAVNLLTNNPIPNGIYRALFIAPTNLDPIRRKATVNIVPYREYKVYITGTG